MLAIPENLRDAIVQYLAARPYAEVAQAIAALQALERLPDPS